MNSISTGKGDEGYTNLFSGNAQVSKNSPICQVLGELDELNSFLGMCRAKSKDCEERLGLYLEDNRMSSVIFDIQNDIFITQAEFAGADKKMSAEKTKRMESLINETENLVPKKNSFIISGEDELSSYFDIARAVCRRAERSAVVYLKEEKMDETSQTLRYLNRLSDFLYCISRLIVFKLGEQENNPEY